MNKIEVKDSVLNKSIVLKDDSIIIYKKVTGNLKLSIKDNIKLFIYIDDSNIDIDFNIENDFLLNIFSYDSSLNINLDLNKESISLEYNYSTVNKNNNKYLVNINHNKENTNSKVINHGLNLDSNSLNFIVNAKVLKKSINVETSQNNKIILMKDNNSLIEPNLYIDNNDTIASHSAYLGQFKKEDIFYLASRGIEKDKVIKLLSKSFIMGHMDISFIEKNIILEKLDLYWR